MNKLQPPASQPQRPQPDPRVEKALRDYDEGKALDKLPEPAAQPQPRKATPRGERSDVVAPDGELLIGKGANDLPPLGAASSEPQEWTHETVMAIAKSSFAHEACHRIAHAHNAALKAERENVAIATEQFLQKLNARDNEILELKKAEIAAEELFRANGILTQELAAERYERWCERKNTARELKAERETVRLAQVALRQIRDEAVTLVDARKQPNSVLHIEAPMRIKNKANAALSSDATALAEHDAALVKPLAEALLCAEYAITHPSSDQQFALNAVRTAIGYADAALES